MNIAKHMMMMSGGKLTDLRRLPNLVALYDLTTPAEVVSDSVGRVAFWRDRSAWSSAMCLALNGVAGNYASTPDTAGLSITGDIDIRAKITPNDWTPAADVRIVSKRGSVTTNYDFSIDGSSTPGRLQFYNGATQTYSSVICGFADGTTHWVRVTRQASATSIIFYTSEDGVTWTQLGTTQTIPNIALTDTADPVEIGTWNGGLTSPFSGLIHYAQILNGIAGTPALTVDFSSAARGATSFVCTTGQTITINTTGASGARIGGARDMYQGSLTSQPIFLPWSGSNYGWLSGVVGNYFSTPDSAALSIVGDIDIRAKVALVDWTPAADTRIVAKRTGAGVLTAYDFYVGATGGTLQFHDGTNTFSSTVAPTVADGATLWIRLTVQMSANLVKYWTSPDGITWTQLGANVARTGTALNDTAGAVEIGSLSVGTAGNANGNFYYADIRNNVLNDGTGIVSVFDPSQAPDGAPSWVSSTGETWTVNQSGGKPALVVGRPWTLNDGVDDFLKTAPFTLNQPTTVYIVARQLAWLINVNLFDGLGAANRMALYQNPATPSLSAYAGTSFGSDANLTLKTAGIVTVVFNGAASKLRVNRLAGTTGDSGAQNAGGLTLGSFSSGAVQWFNGQVCAFAVFSATHDTATQNRILDLLARQNRLVV